MHAHKYRVCKRVTVENEGAPLPNRRIGYFAGLPPISYLIVTVVCTLTSGRSISGSTVLALGRRAFGTAGAAVIIRIIGVVRIVGIGCVRRIICVVGTHIL